jgi:hypothetical protein
MKSQTVIATGIVLLLAALTADPCKAGTISLFQDDFNSFSLGSAWQATAWQGATGAPSTLIGGVNSGGAITLQMGSSTTSTEWKGIETISAIPVGNVMSLILNARTTGSTTGLNASHIEVTLRGSSGAWMKAYYTYEGWTNNYLDSDGNIGTFGLWPTPLLYPANYRRWTFAVDPLGVTASVIDDAGTVRWSQTYSSFTLDDLGSSVSIVLRQDGFNSPTVCIWIT